LDREQRVRCCGVEPRRVLRCPLKSEKESILSELRVGLACTLRHDVEPHPDEQKRRSSINRIGTNRSATRGHSLLKTVERGIEHVRRESFDEGRSPRQVDLVLTYWQLEPSAEPRAVAKSPDRIAHRA